MSASEVAQKAYDKAFAEKITTQPVYIYVDFSLPSYDKRLFVVKEGEIIYSTWVAHGSGSGTGSYAVSFSNNEGTHKSSIGVFKTGLKYVGKHGVSRHINGLEYTNDQAYPRAVVIHSASYIGNGKTGHSWGCFAVPENAIDTVLDYTKPGTIIVAYYPDKDWLQDSKFLN